MTPRCRPLHLLPALLLASLPAQEQPKPQPQKAAALTAPPPQQPQTQEELVKLREEKLAKEVFHKPVWLTDLTKAKARAKETGKPIFALLTRSYAYCSPCEMLEKGALSDAAFGEFAEQVVLFLHVTSRVDGEPQPALLQETGGRGFPYVVFLDADAGVLAPQPYTKFTVAGFRESLEQAVAKSRSLKAKAAAGDDQAGVAWLLQRVEWNVLTATEASAALTALAKVLTDEQRSVIENRRNNAELTEAILAAVGWTPRSMEELAKAGPAVLKLRAAGHVPTDEQGFTLFRNVLVQHAEQGKDVKLFREVLELLRARYADNERAVKQIVEPLAKKLQQLEEAQATGGK